MIGLPLVLASVAALSWGIGSFLNVILARRIGALRSVFWVQLLGIPFLIPGIPAVAYVGSWENFVYASCLGIFIALILALTMYALRIEKSAIVYPVLEAYILVTFFLGIVFLRESITALKLASAVIVCLGIMLLSVNREKLNPIFSKGVLLTLAAALGTGLYFFLVTIQVREIGWFYVTTIIRVAAAATMLALLLWHNRDLRPAFIGVPWVLVTASAVFDVIGFSVYNIAVSHYELSYVQIVASLSILVPTVLGVVLLKERILRYHTIGIVLVILGVVALQL